MGPNFRTGHQRSYISSVFYLMYFSGQERYIFYLCPIQCTFPWETAKLQITTSCFLFCFEHNGFNQRSWIIKLEYLQGASYTLLLDSFAVTFSSVLFFFLITFFLSLCRCNPKLLSSWDMRNWFRDCCPLNDTLSDFDKKNKQTRNHAEEKASITPFFI